MPQKRRERLSGFLLWIGGFLMGLVVGLVLRNRQGRKILVPNKGDEIAWKFIEDIAPAWLPHAVRARRQELLRSRAKEPQVD